MNRKRKKQPRRLPPTPANRLLKGPKCSKHVGRNMATATADTHVQVRKDEIRTKRCGNGPSLEYIYPTIQLDPTFINEHDRLSLFSSETPPHYEAPRDRVGLGGE